MPTERTGEIPEALTTIRNRWPVARCDAKTWAEIERLSLTGDSGKIKQADELARKCILEHPRLRARHDGAVTARTQRKKFLVVQRSRERLIADALSTGADRMASAVNRFSDDAGVVSSGRMAALMTRLGEINREVYRQINSVFLATLRLAAAMGLKSAMAQAESVVNRARALRVKAEEAGSWQCAHSWALPADHWLVGLAEAAADPLRAKISYPVASTVFKRLFKGALKDTMAAGVFGKTGVSNRVWDLRDQNLLVLKRLVVGGITRGDSAAKISRDIRGLLHQPSTLRGEAFDDARPGPGVYRSAYKNAMRLTRTESNRAFVGADMLFAAEKGWQVVYQVSTGQREFDECDSYNGKGMTPEEFADIYPVHVHCLCYSSIVVPEVG